MAEYIERTEELMLAMNAGARAIENTRRYHGAVYTKDVFSESPQEIPYLQATKVLREASDAPAADVALVVHGRWEYIQQTLNTLSQLRCPFCAWWSLDQSIDGIYKYCPNCGAKMDGGDNNEAD